MAANRAARGRCFLQNGGVPDGGCASILFLDIACQLALTVPRKRKFGPNSEAEQFEGKPTLARVHLLYDGGAYWTQSELTLAASQFFTTVPKSVSVVSPLLENRLGVHELSVTHAVQLAP